MNRNKKIQRMMKVAGVVISTLILFTSCATYYLTQQSLVEQVINSQPEKKVTVAIVFPIIIPGVVTGNSLREIKVKDKKGNEVILPVTNRTAIRITQNNGKRTTFYLNTLIIQDSMITGKKDHFIGMSIKPININNIKLIEVEK
ncbi:MAG: hypothetical protein AB1304_06740 [Bacteroidota bacterium]